jgi:protein-tyrosine phosphatase
MGFVDLHSHVLFALDDGSPDRATSLAMIGALHQAGFSEVYATPHQKARQFLPSLEAIGQTYAELRDAARQGTPQLRLGLGAENMWDDVFFERVQRAEIPAYDGGPAFLMELRPSEMPGGLLAHMFRLRTAGRVPVLAHPERYHALWENEELTLQLRRQCAFQIDLPALAGYHGKREAKAARKLVENGLATVASTDCHTPEDVRRAAEGIGWIEKKMGSATVDRLLTDAPRAVLAGNLPD